MLRFSENAFTRVILYMTLKKNIKMYKNMGVATKAPHALIWRKTAIFLSMDGLIFTKTFESGFFDFKQIHNSTKINKISCKIRYMAKIVIFGPHRSPLARFSF